jgi:hypothetical protein
MFVVDKVALGQVFLRVVGFPLSISFHWCSITCKTLLKKSAHLHLHHRVAEKALRLWCVRSICCGALHHVKRNRTQVTFVRSLLVVTKVDRHRHPNVSNISGSISEVEDNKTWLEPVQSHSTESGQTAYQSWH